MSRATKPKQILVIDGGGMRGLASLMIVDAIMKEITTKSGKVLRPCEVFDLIGGTSVGGLISILLGRLGLDCQTAIDIYKTIVKKLFGEQRDAWNVIQTGEFLNTSEFDKYIAEKVEEFAGSPDAVMNLALEDGQDLRDHPNTMTFVALMEDAPSYTHMITSYTREKLSASAARRWTITDVMQASIASPIYLSPLSFKTDTTRRFQDAGFGGYNNPVALASSARKGIWSREPIGTVISLGTGLQGYLPKQLPTTRVWGPQPAYVGKLCDQVFRERLPTVHRYGDSELNVAHAIRELARIAADSNLYHIQFSEHRSSFCEHYHRIDEPFGLGHFDLIDIHHEETIKARIDAWLQEEGVIKEIVENLGVENWPPATQ